MHEKHHFPSEETQVIEQSPRANLPTEEELRSLVEHVLESPGNDSLVFFARIQHPKIRSQLIDHFVRAYEAYERAGHTERRWKVDAHGEYVYEQDGGHVLEEIPFHAPTREEIAHQLDEWVQEEMFVTPIDYTSDIPSVMGMHLGWIDPKTGEKPTTRVLSAIEAHEKGHGVRLFSRKGVAEYFAEQFVDVLDIHAVHYTEEMFERDKKLFGEHITRREAQKIVHDTLRDPMEVVERMAQLKNYFGMQGDEVFTKAHLEYARAHYTSQVMDNFMKEFFQAITPRTEARFLEVINTLGV